MEIAVGNNFARVTASSHEEDDWLDEYLSISEPQFRKDFRTGRMKNVGTTSVSFYKKERFPAGFLRLVWKGAKREGYKVELTDEREPPSAEPVPLNLPIANTYDEEKALKEQGVERWLRYYQHDAIEEIVKKRRGVIWHSTGAGKTEIAANATERIPIQWLFVVQDKALLHNAAERYEKVTGKKANIIGDGLRELNNEGNFTVAMAQTLDRNRDDLEIWAKVRNAEGIIIDECHQTPAKTIFQITVASERAVYRIGLSGTPFDRSDRKGMLTIGALGPVIHRVKNEELVETGFVAEAKVTMIECDQDCDAPTYQGAYGKLIVRSAKRNKLAVKVMTDIAKPNLTFVKEVKHGKSLMERAEKAGLRCAFVWGDKATKQRDNAIKRLVRGEIDIIVCNVVFQQGINIPELRSVFRASGGKSIISALQFLGRGSRRLDDKDSFEYVDIFDTGNKWMEKHSKGRKKAYEREGHKVVVSNPSQLELAS